MNLMALITSTIDFVTSLKPTCEARFYPDHYGKG